MNAALTVERAPVALADADRGAVAALIDTVASADAVAPLSEAARLAVAHGRPEALHMLSRGRPTGPVIGYLFLNPAEDGGGRTAELCVAPDSRRRGIGRALLSAALRETTGALSVWAHGNLPAAQALAAQLRFAKVRDLRLLEAAVGTDGAPAVAPPEPGLALRAFRPGEDDAAWLALNAAAFAHHPEQGRWTGRDLAERLAEPWFDPAGFLLLEQNGRLVGFHWTKVHPAGAYGPDPVGEIYVLGVHPDASGSGLGRLLATAGLSHLAQSGLRTAVLYVDGDNLPALRLYESLGFHTRSVDALYERPRSG
jgi:mycothiol synthase